MKPIRRAHLSILNVVTRIQTRLRQIEPEFGLFYSPTANRYQVYGATVEPMSVEPEELLGLLRFLGSRHTYDEVVTMSHRASTEHKAYEMQPLSRRKFLPLITLLENGAVEKPHHSSREGPRPLRLDYCALMDDTKPEAPQAASDPPEPDFDLPDFETMGRTQAVEHYSV